MKTLRKMMSVFLVLCMSMAMVVPCAANADDTVVITTAYQLMSAVNAPDKDYVLGADIVFTENQFVSGGQYYNDGKGFTVLGSASKPFSGTFDGNGHVIKGVKINRPTEQYVGLFGYVTGTVKNVALVDADITGGYYTGGVAGYVASGATVTQCYTSSGVVRSKYSGSNVRLGGLLGYLASNATLSNSYNTANVVLATGKSGYAAGLVGEKRGRTNCCYNAAVFDENTKYGIMALGETLYTSYTYTVGGSEFCVVSDNLYTRPSYWKTDAELKSQSSMSGYDFTNIWKYDTSTGYPYPTLRANPHVMTAKSSGSFPSGTGTAYDPYVIKTSAQFSLIANDPYACYRLATSPTLSDSYTTIPLFRGILYGDNYIISTTSPLFAENKGRIENANVSALFTKGTNVGAVAVKNSNTVINCKVSGTVTGTNAGGICYENTGRILGCTSTASVTATNGAAGGLAVKSTGLIGYNSINKGAVTSKNGVAGGIAATAAKPGSISYVTENYGAVTGVTNVGGIVGELACEINKAANYGNITASGANSAAGGIAGNGSYQAKCSVVQNNAYVEGATAGGIIGSNYGVVINALNSGVAYGKKIAGGIAGTNNASSNGAVGNVNYVINYGSEVSETGTVAVIVGINNGSSKIDYATYLPTTVPAYTGSKTGVGSSVKSLTRDQFADPGSYMAAFDLSATWESVSALPTLRAFPYTAVTGITLDKSSATAMSGKTVLIKATVSPQNATIPDIAWTSSNTSAATVSTSGVVTVKSKGTAVITATSNGKSAKCTIKGVAIERLAGSNRILTANAISDKGWTSANTVVLANSLNYADALAGVPYAASLNAPILLTAGKTLEADVASQIKKLGASKVIILGGYKVISENVENELKQTLTVERIYGSNRYATCFAIAKKFASTKNVIVVTGTNYADALSISPYASLKQYPIIYCEPQAGLSADLNAMVKNATTVTVIGGEKVVPSQHIPRTFTRVSGSTRYLTSYEIAKKYASLFGNDITIATGTNFPDALAGGVLCAKLKTPLLLANSNILIDEIKSFIRERNPSTIYVLGGEKVVPSSTFNNLF